MIAEEKKAFLDLCSRFSERFENYFIMVEGTDGIGWKGNDPKWARKAAAMFQAYFAEEKDGHIAE